MDPNHTSNRHNLSGQENGFFDDDRAHLESRLYSGANWFFWIAGLSIVSSLIVIKNKLGFLIGLGITQSIDYLLQGLEMSVGEANQLLITANLLFAGFFAVFGLLARKRYNLAFIVGMGFYILDGVIILVMQNWFGVAFHAFALYFLFQGLSANLQLRNMEEALAQAAAKGA